MDRATWEVVGKGVRRLSGHDGSGTISIQKVVEGVRVMGGDERVATHSLVAVSKEGVIEFYLKMPNAIMPTGSVSPGKG